MRALFAGIRRVVEAAELGVVDVPPQLETEGDPTSAPVPAPAVDPERDQRFYQVGQFERRVPVTAPTRADGHACPRCAGLEQVIRQLENERKQLRSRLAGHELAATRDQRLGPVTGQLP